MPNSYKSKVIVSGNIVEIYNYEYEILEGFNKDSKGRSVSATKEDKLINREKVLTRARRDLRRLINSNIHQYGLPSKFVTLTFREDIKELKKANYEFNKFVKRLNYELNIKLKYVVVPEFTKKGRVHYHVVMFNIPYVSNNKLADIWENGFIKINCIEKVENVGAYVCKYMYKDSADERLEGNKCYFGSRGLYKPIEVKEKEMVENFAHSLPQSCLAYNNVFTNDYNTVTYSQYILK